MKKALTILTLAVACATLAHMAIAAPDSISPTTKAFALTQGSSDSYTVTLTSPTSLNGSGDDALAAGGIDVTLAVDVVDKPLGVSDADALALVSRTPTHRVYTALNQAQTFSIGVATTAGTTVGDYSYSLHARNSDVNGFGWGLSFSTLNVSVSEPMVSDITPPVVTITDPASDGATYVFGAPAAIGYNAVEDMSPITVLSATIDSNTFTPTTLTGLGTTTADANGSFTASAIGTHTLDVHAESAGGQADATRTFIVNYNSGFLPPISLGKTSRGGSTMPIKFTVSDAIGNFISDTSVEVVVKEGAITVFSAAYGEGASNVRISEIDMQYIVNFQTASGAHTYTVYVYFDDLNGDPLQQAATSFTTR